MKIKIHRIKHLVKETIEEKSIQESHPNTASSNHSKSNPYKELLLSLLKDKDSEFVIKLVSKIKIHKDLLKM